MSFVPQSGYIHPNACKVYPSAHVHRPPDLVLLSSWLPSSHHLFLINLLSFLLHLVSIVIAFLFEVCNSCCRYKIMLPFIVAAGFALHAYGTSLISQSMLSALDLSGLTTHVFSILA